MIFILNIIPYSKQVANIVGEEELKWAEERAAAAAAQNVQIVYVPLSNDTANNDVQFIETPTSNTTQRDAEIDMEIFMQDEN